jgi:hypothetical protein
MSPRAAVSPPLCPSAQPDMEGAVVFGVVGGSGAEPRVGYVTERLPVTPELLALTGAVRPAEVFRFGAPCAGGGCRHFDGADCRLAAKLVQLAPAKADASLPACVLRPDCRWWRQEGKAACMRCPQVVTVNHLPSEEMRHAANPDS